MEQHQTTMHTDESGTWQTQSTHLNTSTVGNGSETYTSREHRINGEIILVKTYSRHDGAIERWIIYVVLTGLSAIVFCLIICLGVYIGKQLIHEQPTNTSILNSFPNSRTAAH